MKNVMSVRKTVNRGSLFLYVAITIGFCFATYCALLLSAHDRARVDPVIKMPEERKRAGFQNPKKLFHVAVTATDTPYSKWQCRIMYYWYKKVKDLPGSGMGGFTRVLHSGRADNLMEEIPSFVVDPLPDGIDRVSYYYLCLNQVF